MKFSEFRDQIHRELNDYNYQGVKYDSQDSYRLATSDDIKMWVNDTLNSLAESNPGFWFNKILMPKINNSNVIVVPRDVLEINQIEINGNKYRIGMIGDDFTEKKPAIYIGENKIELRYALSLSDTVYVYGAFYPQQVEDDNTEIDIPKAWMRLCKLAVLQKVFSRRGEKNEMIYMEYLTALKKFRKAAPPVHSTGQLTPNVTFYV